MNAILSRIYNGKWAILGILLIALLIWIAWPFLDVFIYALFVYFITRPIKKWLSRYIRNESLLVLACLILLVTPLIIIISYTLLVGLSEFNNLIHGVGLNSGIAQGPLAELSKAAYEIQQNLTIDKINLENLSSLSEEKWYKMIADNIGSMAGIQNILLATGSTIVDILFKLFLIFMVAFYMIRDDDKLKSWAVKTFPRLMEEHGGVFKDYYHAVDLDLDKIFFGNILSIVFFAIVAAVTFSVINIFAPDPTLEIPAAILMGILCGISALVPVVGMGLILVPLLLYIAINSLIAGTLLPNIAFFIMMIVVIFIFVETLPDFVIRPFMARGNIHKGLLMFAYILGPIVFGISGLFLGAIVLVLISNYFTIVVPRITKNYFGEGTSIEEAKH